MKRRKKNARAVRGTVFETIAFSKSGQNANGRKAGMRGPKPVAGTPASDVRMIEITDEERDRYKRQ